MLAGVNYVIEDAHPRTMMWKAVEKFREDTHMLPTDVALNPLHKKIWKAAYWIVPIRLETTIVDQSEMPHPSYAQQYITIHFHADVALNQVRCIRITERTGDTR